MNTSPRNAMIQVAEAWYLMPRNPWVCPKPGQAYERLPDEVKEILKHLKSEDIRDVRSLE